ncbi:hypothetical protein PUNSTDRAFT_91371 [Punctularia strigosozonata HHB-11173 SS5]|uniref:uncharacterized protein n=1 Tax=Punctularia strigosozonata (strain HHB-11173) TaxID=741275 RepID=UPI0004418183|nr:uncharacterized protein PUNSTDRAFT_91371 [Punctularia strigosozonata HHB-11173 SS5]EIN05784.1 hypothetical protein PUNSTDRAFT_91371 [Punctularia strigosozonata HHB-11173 SS5]
MFKKPLADLKTSAPIRSSDRRKLKQKVVQTFGLQAEEGDLLVPEGLQSVKFSTHVGEHGIAYLAAEGDPLWFTIGKGSEELIPTVYTLWKQPRLLPFLSTPSAVIPVLIGGADLMIPGIVQHSSNLAPNQLVSVTQYHAGKLGYPLGVGRMAVGSDKLQSEDGKGKGVLILHTWKDKLWDLGSKGEPPEPMDITTPVATSEQGGQDGSAPTANNPNSVDGKAQETETDPKQESTEGPLTPEEVSSILRTALLQAIQTTLSQVPSSTFPIPATTFYTTYLLPHRPSYSPSPTSVDIKHSAFKSLSAFLKACEKDGMLSLKQVKGDYVITGVKADHPDVAGHHAYRTLKMEEEKKEKREAREKEEGAKKGKEMVVVELWKPHQATIRLFEEAGKDPSAMYSLTDIKTILNGYVAAKNLVNQREQQYINVSVDDVLAGALSSKNAPPPDFMKREDICKLLSEKMQAWYKLQPEGKDVVVKKGQLRPISVQVKIRQGRKACTLITGFEPFLLDADELAEELRKSCASSTAVAPLPGKNAGLEVMVQGKQMGPVAGLLQAKGVPARWIETADMTAKKK